MAHSRHHQEACAAPNARSSLFSAAVRSEAQSLRRQRTDRDETPHRLLSNTSASHGIGGGVWRNAVTDTDQRLTWLHQYGSVGSAVNRCRQIESTQEASSSAGERTSRNKQSIGRRSRTTSHDRLEVSYYTDEELTTMDRLLNFVIPDMEVLQTLRAKVLAEMELSAQSLLPCGVCELEYCPSKISVCPVNDILVKQMSRCLKAPGTVDIPDFIIGQYDVSNWDSRLQGLLIYPEGKARLVYTSNNTAHKYSQFLICSCADLLAMVLQRGIVFVQICADCKQYLNKSCKKVTQAPPPLSIANGNYIGHLPSELGELNRTDEQAIALLSPCMSLSTVTGGPCRVLKSHHYIVENTEGPIAEMLPRELRSRVRVAMVGSMTSAQKASCRRRYDLDIQRCRRTLEFLYANNREYKRFIRRNPRSAVDLQNIRTTSVIIDKTNLSDDTATADVDISELRDDTAYSTFGSEVTEGQDHTLESASVDLSSVIMHQVPAASTDVLVYKSNAYVSAKGWSACVQMFPTLFPGGCGGPKEPRPKPLSIRNWIVRCLRIHHRRFELHYAFLLLAFDYLASKNAREKLFVKMHASAHAVQAGNISQATLKRAIQYYNEMTLARARGQQPNPPPPDVDRVIDLRKGFRSPEAAFFGSNASRMHARHDLFGYLKRLGPAQIFFTVSPDSAGTYSIAISAGEIESNVVAHANQLLPTRAERKKIAADHPVECARYFMCVMNTVVNDILGWDQFRGKSKRGGGVFGVVKAFGAASETQVAGNLHAHFVIWLHGFPTSTSLFRLALRDDTFCTRLLRLVDSILTIKPPCLDSNSQCHKCGSRELRSVQPGVDAFRKPPPGATPPLTATCDSCHQFFRDKDVIDAALQALADRKNIRIEPNLIDYYKCHHATEAISNDVLAISIVVRDVQVHFWNHSKSCFKVTVRTPKGSVCRFFKPEEAHLGPSSIGTDSIIRLHRPIGCEYVNAYNPTLMSVLKCNHDIQFILCSESKDTAAYVCKYCMKQQNPVENQAALSLAAFAKAATQANALPNDTPVINRGYKILASMLYALTNGQEVPAPMAALYVIRESPFWFSHECVHVNLWTLIQIPSNTEEINVSTRISRALPNSTQYTQPQNLLRNYWHRQDMLEQVSFMDICEQYDQVASKKRRLVSSTDVGEATIHCVQYVKSEKRKIVVICGRDIPDVLNLPDQSTADYYYSALLVLFKPHREGTLFGPFESPLAAYRNYMNCGDSDRIRSVQSFEATYKAFYRSQAADEHDMESPEAHLLRTRRGPSVPWSGIETNDGEVSSNSDVDSIADFLDNVEDQMLNITPEHASMETVIHNSRTIINEIDNLSLAIASTVSMYPSTDILTVNPSFNLDGYSKQLISSESYQDSDDRMGTDRFISAFSNAETRLERLEECFVEVPWPNRQQNPRWSHDTLPTFPTISLVSEAFKLNMWQHVIFEMAARHLLYEYSRDIDSALNEPIFPHGHIRQPYQIKPQLVAYLGGEAGTGKSVVIHALLAFAKKWGRAGSVETMAFTGVAAINVNGKTMHSARNLKLNGLAQNASPTLDMKARYRCVFLVVIDEISMTDQGLLGGTDAASRALSSRPDLLMGGKHVLMTGDFLQLPPIGGSLCFIQPPAASRPARHAGYALYSDINFVVFLTENMRAQRDPVYTEILSNLRWGRLSSVQLSDLNSRVLANQTSPLPTSSQHLDAFYRPVLVSTNKLRCALNREMTFSAARRLGVPIYECIAQPVSRSSLITSHLINANDDLTAHIPMKFQFYIGMPIMISRKHPDLLETNVIANGVLGTVVGFYPQLTETNMSAVQVENVTVKRFVRPPHLLLIKVSKCHKRLVNGFPNGVIGLPPLKAQIALNKIQNLARSSITVIQFALVPAFACTTEKLQGQTCHDGILITPLERRQGVPHQTLYVALSRATSLDSITLTRPLTWNYLAKFTPTNTTVTEMQRLMNLVALPSYISRAQSIAFSNWKQNQKIG